MRLRRGRSAGPDRPDPAPEAPAPSVPSGAPSSASTVPLALTEPLRHGKGHRSWAQRLLIVFNSMCIVAAVATAGVLGYSNKQLSKVSRVGLSGVLRADSDTKPGAPLNYLLVGADDGSSLAPDDPANKGRGALDAAAKSGTFRTDTIMILRIDPKDATARLLSIPRDLWVSIPGFKSKTRINSAVEGFGGSERLIETLKLDFGIPIDHYIQVNFRGFKDLVSAIGGVPIYFPEPVRVLHTTAFIVPQAGCHTLDGNEALAFVRVRKDYQVYRNGRWRTDPTGDLGRISRQQYFIQVALKRAISKGIRDPNILRKLVGVGLEAVKLDNRFRTDDVIALGNRFRNFNPDTLVKYTIPATDAVHGGAQVLDLDAKAAEPILDIFRGNGTTAAATAAAAGGGSTASLNPTDVKVQVLNGGQPRGSAKVVTSAFTTLGFKAIIPTDAPPGFPGTDTTLEYGPGKLAQARFVARYISGPVLFEEKADVTASDVVVILAQDWTGTRRTPKADSAVPVPSTSSTTTPATTTTGSTVPPTSTTVVGDVPGGGVTCH